MSNKDTKNSASHRLNIATVGSKNRVCLPPATVDHHKINPGDHVVWLNETDKKGRPYSIMHAVKPANFEIDAEPIEVIEDTFKKEK